MNLHRVRLSALASVAAIALSDAAVAGIFSGDGGGTVAPPPAPAPEPVVEVPAVPAVVPAVPVAVPAAVPVVVPAAVPAAVPVPVSVPVSAAAPAAPATVAVPESVILGPSAEDSSDPKRLLHVFCQAWKDEDWKKAWYCMEPAYRQKTAFESFLRRFKDDSELTGGLDDETIAPSPRVNGSRQTFDVTLSFQNAPMVRPRKVKATLRTTPDGYRLVESAILPADLGDM